ncbi:MAG: DUF4214 domain-containing protein, partial [Acidobacteriota bacterium]|nr:DUF4214 domain-containing protein [Acidobacteriota bacterium]
SPTRLYSTPQSFGFGVQRFNVSAAGVSFDSTVGGGKGGTIKYFNGLIYTSNGSVIDPETGELKGTFSLGETGSGPNLMTVDVALGRAYFFLLPSGGRGRVSVFDINTFLPLGEFPVQYRADAVEGLSFEFSSLVRWGQNGLAFRTASHINIIQSALIGPGAFPAPTPTPAAPGQARQNLLKARRDAQNVSNELPTAAPAVSTAPALSTSDVPDRIGAVVAAIQQTYVTFGAERSFYPAAARIEDALTKALDYAARAGTSAGQQQFADVKSNLRRAIDYLELADVRMVHGDVNNAVDYPAFFVRQHYVDFLGREPDEAGRAFWANAVVACGADRHCATVKRVDTSAAFFLSIEFQETGYLVYRLYRASLGRTVRHQEFLADTQEVGRGVTVGATGWAEKLNANKRAFYQAWVQRPDFRARYDSLTPEQFVDHLFATAGFAPEAATRDALVADLRRGVARADVLAKVVDGEALRRQELNRAFVLMQYFGYLQRDPDQAGYDFWLGKLEDNGGDFRRAEMVRAFLDSIEYRERFGRL